MHQGNHYRMLNCPADSHTFYAYHKLWLGNILLCANFFPSASHTLPLRKHAYSNILKILPLKNENFQIKSSDIFHITAQNIDCGYSLEPPRRGGSNEYPQSMFRAEIRKITYTLVNPSFTT